ncbi:hypothetical protein COJ29_12505 [Bacillus cereus]|uniref:hypothetical protein n=1 Tax=Bacillus cereus TaxID=1396 RepID=UPI000BF70B84|nr:hypothetical protein [Bacillus cereus]PFK91897.1 hypothetical protein COJ29_12505 [Bacillus cereus]PFM45826.1 hypothetical protein COJ49_30240 [Bacillus cereus]PGZ57016.1 hypothetical protein COF02_29055 [Bacillus cereus]
MKAAKLVFLAFPLMLLGVGCDMSKDHPKDTKTKETIIKEDTTTETPVKENQMQVAVDYKSSVLDLNKKLENAMNELSTIVTKDSTLSVSKDSYKNALLYLRNVTKKYDNLKPSHDPAYKQEETHKLILDSMKTMQDAISIQYTSIDNIASEEFMRGLNLTNEASNKFIEAMKTLK